MSIHQSQNESLPTPDLGKIGTLREKIKGLLAAVFVGEDSIDPTYQGDFSGSEIEHAFATIELMKYELGKFANREGKSGELLNGMDELLKSHEEEIESLQGDLREAHKEIRKLKQQGKTHTEAIVKERLKFAIVASNVTYNGQLEKNFHNIRSKMAQSDSIQEALLEFFHGLDAYFKEIECQMIFLSDTGNGTQLNDIAVNIKSTYDLIKQQKSNTLKDASLEEIVEKNILFGFGSTGEAGPKKIQKGVPQLRTLQTKDVEYLLSHLPQGSSSHFLGKKELQVVQNIFRNKTMQSGFIFLFSNLGIMIFIAHPNKNHYHSEQKRESLGNFLEGTGQTLQLITKIERDSKDSLTQMHRRGNQYRLFKGWMEKIQSKDRDPYTETTVAFIDFDNFKSINDKEGGHGTGDLVIQTIAAIIRESIRSVNLSIRWGGDEILLILNTPEALSREVLERVISKVSKTIFVYHAPENGKKTGYYTAEKQKKSNNLQKNDFRVSISTGITPLENMGTGKIIDDFNAAIIRADHIIMTQKQGGIKGGIYSQNDLPKI